MKALKIGLEQIDRGLVVHGCNAQGVMGSGVARALRERHPRMFHDYRKVFESEGLALGSVIWTPVHENLHIASAITQEFYGRYPGRQYVCYDALDSALKKVRQKAIETNLPIFINPIGCGLGGGKWEVVGPMLENAFEGLEWSLCDPTMGPQPNTRPPKIG